jgi:uncharacterized SAM-binding protein YcdF (DUF218 family)
MKRSVVVAVIVLGSLAILIVAAFFGVGFYLSPQSPLQKAAVIVAISGGETGARTTAAVNLYQDGYAPHLIFSGAAADVTGPSNARAMADTAVAAGVPPAAIELDETSTDTAQNAANVAAIIHRDGYRSLILITSPYHQRRASIEFHRALGAGYTIINHSSYDQGWRRSDWWATPASRALTFSELQKVGYELLSGSNQ